MRRGLAPSGEPKGAMLNSEWYFNWRSKEPNHRPPVNYDWMVELLMHCLMLDNEMLRHMSGAILSEAYGTALIMVRSQFLIEMPDWMPEQYQHPGHSFGTWMYRMRFMAPALVAALGSDPENTIRTRCQNNGIPAHFKEIPVTNYATHTEESSGSEERVNSPVVTFRRILPNPPTAPGTL